MKGGVRVERLKRRTRKEETRNRGNSWWTTGEGEGRKEEGGIGGGVRLEGRGNDKVVERRVVIFLVPLQGSLQKYLISRGRSVLTPAELISFARWVW